MWEYVCVRVCLCVFSRRGRVLEQNVCVQLERCRVLEQCSPDSVDLICKNNGEGRALSGANWGQMRPASSASTATHIKHGEAVLRGKLSHFSSTEENNSYKCHTYSRAKMKDTMMNYYYAFLPV